jgi:hypothetical protein
MVDGHDEHPVVRHIDRDDRVERFATLGGDGTATTGCP